MPMRCIIWVVTMGVLLGLLTVGASAQFVQTVMRGNTYAAAPGITTAWTLNPAGLSALSGMARDELAVEPRSGWNHAATGEFELSGDRDLTAVNWAGIGSGGSTGFGAGFVDEAGVNYFGLGIGKTWTSKKLAWGASWKNWDVDGGDSQSGFDVGVMGKLGAGGTGATSARWGVVLHDLTDEVIRTWDVGVALDMPQGFLLAADFHDLTDEGERTFHVGASRQFGSRGEWEGGVGFNDGELTLGAMYTPGRVQWQGGTWRFGAAWSEADAGNDTLIVGAFGNWGW